MIRRRDPAKCSFFMMMMMMLAWASLVGGAIFLIWADNCLLAEAFHLDMVYRYSNEFRALMQARNKAVLDWHKAGTLEHYEKLIKRDLHRHAHRGLITSQDGSFSLSPANESTYFDTLGGLHYSLITIGTPSLTFLVALDTGSDLLWVPCNCQQCSPTNLASYGLQSENIELSVYNPSNSKTSQPISCSNSLCSSTLFTKNCTNANANCNYIVTYISPNTSTSGPIVQDLLYLNPEGSNGGTITTPIYFGCGEVQTGALVSGGAPDGLLGLGPNEISIPSTLARAGVVSNSFSMCFSSSDLSGRLFFGSKGDKGLQSTTLVPINPRENYVVSTTKLVVGGDNSIEVSMTMVFDTGTSFTMIPQPTYQDLGKIFNQKINLTPLQHSGTFDYCWIVSDSEDLNSLPTLSITFSGGSNWGIQTPYATFNDSMGNVQYICLGILEGSIGIIGHNFMGGYEFFFDQDLMTLSWGSSTCYTLNATTTKNTMENPIDYAPSSSPNSSKKKNDTNKSIDSVALKFTLFFVFMIVWIHSL